MTGGSHSPRDEAITAPKVMYAATLNDTEDIKAAREGKAKDEAVDDQVPAITMPRRRYQTSHQPLFGRPSFGAFGTPQGSSFVMKRHDSPQGSQLSSLSSLLGASPRAPTVVIRDTAEEAEDEEDHLSASDYRRIRNLEEFKLRMPAEMHLKGISQWSVWKRQVYHALIGAGWNDNIPLTARGQGRLLYEIGNTMGPSALAVIAPAATGIEALMMLCRRYDGIAPTRTRATSGPILSP
ncbi:hypothetical protein EDB81DRAFT_765116 [Dactylonectria macrodidyma]|uniref:Uncharacterized protein n=1 Tax=Dactylonectria macrodidyma TaxID=307937 RepID=A0A9P9IMR2_9HYPO|nr:hypothetical protein EDB81DRAFT_765116 [Dactylonectria macrodidyma]